MDESINGLLALWKKRNIEGLYCETKESAVAKILDMVPAADSIGISGSVTLDQIGVVARLNSRGNKVYNQYKTGINRQESLRIRQEGAQADWYLSSANAVAATGELVFLSAYGQRLSGIANAKHVLLVCGINKICENLPVALARAREYVTPLNCKRLSWPSACLADGRCRKDECVLPKFRRMCCQTLIIEAEVAAQRLKVLMVGEKLGY